MTTFPQYTRYTYKNFVYDGDYHEDPDDRTRKMWHTVINNDTKERYTNPEGWGPYFIPSYDEFVEFVKKIEKKC